MKTASRFWTLELDQALIMMRENGATIAELDEYFGRPVRSHLELLGAYTPPKALTADCHDNEVRASSAAFLADGWRVHGRQA